MFDSVLEAYGLTNNCKIISFGNGLINRTWKVDCGEEAYILQKINHQVFVNPEAIAENISLIQQYLQQHYPSYIFPTPIKNKDGETILYIAGDGYYRITPFVKASHSVDAASSTRQAYEASMSFGQFTHLLSGFDVSRLQITLKDFHDLTLRYHQFQEAIIAGNKERIAQTQDLIKELQAQQYIVEVYQSICASTAFKVRVTHHDTKISNVLFDREDNSICVIDLDTVMPGYFISDVGDMMRTYLSPVSEEEADLSKIEVREDYFKAIVSGYLHYMQQDLTQKEKEAFVYAGKFMIYMQALRFLTDYLNNDVYYGAAYPEHNLVRAKNQTILLRKICSKETELNALVTEALESFEASAAV